MMRRRSQSMMRRMQSLLGAVLTVALLGANPARAAADTLEQALREQRYGAALQFADASLNEHPGDLRLLTARGLALGGLQRTGESLSAFEAVLGTSPAFVPALKGAAQTSYAARDPRAVAFLKRLLALDSSDATAHGMSAVLAFEAGDCASAAAHFEAGREETEAKPQAYAMYGVCLLKLRRAKEALTVFERLVRADPTSSATARSLASAQAADANPRLAASTLVRALQMRPEEEQTYVDLAALYILNSASEDALAVIQAGIRKLPQSARLYSLRGVVEAENGLPAEAENDFGTANRLDPKGQYGSAGLGVLYTDTDRAVEGLALLRSRLEKSPSDATLNYLLAQALVREGPAPGSPEFQEAVAALIRATRSRPDYGAAHTALGRLYKASGDEERAMAELRTAIKLDGSDRAALNHLADLLRRSGRMEEAAVLTKRLRQLVIDGAGNAPTR